MTVHLDTSTLVDALTGPRRSLPTLIRLVESSRRLSLSSLVLYEWRRGPRTPVDLEAQRELFGEDAIVAFDNGCAAEAAKLYTTVRKPRGREIDLAIAACAIVNGAALWTLNTSDFADIPGLTLV